MWPESGNKVKTLEIRGSTRVVMALGSGIPSASHYLAQWVSSPEEVIICKEKQVMKKRM